jgi:hypothetical protein
LHVFADDDCATGEPAERREDVADVGLIVGDSTVADVLMSATVESDFAESGAAALLGAGAGAGATAMATG